MIIQLIINYFNYYYYSINYYTQKIYTKLNSNATSTFGRTARRNN